MFDVRLQGRTISRATAPGAVVHFSTDFPHAMFEGFPRPGYQGYFDEGAVRIESDQADRPLSRANAREAFSHMSHKLKWDTLDVLYFIGYAPGTMSPHRLCLRGLDSNCERVSRGTRRARPGGASKRFSPRISRLIPA